MSSISAHLLSHNDAITAVSVAATYRVRGGVSTVVFGLQE